MSSAQHGSAEPSSFLAAEAHAIVRFGKALLNAGASSERIRQSMERAARALDIDWLQSQVTLSELSVTLFRGTDFRTQVGQIHSLGVNAMKIGQLERLAEGLKPGSTAAEVEAALDAIDRQPHLYNKSINAAFGALACAAFAYLNNGGFVEVIAVLLAAFCGQFIRVNLLRRHLNQFVAALSAGFIASGVYVALTEIVTAVLADTGRHGSGYVAAVLFLVPGFPLVTAALDLAKLDFTAGLSRLAYALMIIASAAVALVTLTWALGLQPTPLPPLELDPIVRWSLRALASFVGVYGFASMFNTQPRVAVVASVIGMVSNVMRLGVADLGAPLWVATFLAALLIGLAAAWAKHLWSMPAITTSVPATLIMIPGAVAFRGLVYMVQNDIGPMMSNLTMAVLIMVGLAIGLSLARMLTDKRWAFDRREPWASRFDHRG